MIFSVYHITTALFELYSRLVNLTFISKPSFVRDSQSVYLSVGLGIKSCETRKCLLKVVKQKMLPIATCGNLIPNSFYNHNRIKFY